MMTSREKNYYRQHEDDVARQMMGGTAMTKRYFHGSIFCNESESKKEGEVDDAEGFQNPLHVDDPKKTLVMLEDFEKEGIEPEMAALPPIHDGANDSAVLAGPHIHELADEIIHLNMLEMKELVDRMSEHFGIEDDDDAMFMGGGGGGGGSGDGAADGGEAKEEKTAFDLKLTGFDAKAKIKVIKEVRAITSLGLKDAKALVEGAPTTVKTDIKMEEAEELKAKLEAIGATCTIE